MVSCVIVGPKNTNWGESIGIVDPAAIVGIGLNPADGCGCCAAAVPSMAKNESSFCDVMMVPSSLIVVISVLLVGPMAVKAAVIFLFCVYGAEVRAGGKEGGHVNGARDIVDVGRGSKVVSVVGALPVSIDIEFAAVGQRHVIRRHEAGVCGLVEGCCIVDARGRVRRHVVVVCGIVSVYCFLAVECPDSVGRNIIYRHGHAVGIVCTRPDWVCGAGYDTLIVPYNSGRKGDQWARPAGACYALISRERAQRSGGRVVNVLSRICVVSVGEGNRTVWLGTSRRPVVTEDVQAVVRTRRVDVGWLNPGIATTQKIAAAKIGPRRPARSALRPSNVCAALVACVASLTSRGLWFCVFMAVRPFTCAGSIFFGRWEIGLVGVCSSIAAASSLYLGHFKNNCRHI
jgi:hypothetical protein